MSERFKNFQLENAKLRDEIKRLKGALREIECDNKKNIVLRPRKELFKKEIEDKQLGFELPKMMIFRSMYAGLTDKEEFVFRGSFGQTNEETLEDVKKNHVEGKENEGTILNQQSKPPNINQIDPNITLNPLETIKSPEYTLSSPTALQQPIPIKDSFSSFYNEESTNQIFDLSSPKLEKIPPTHPSTSLQASSHSILLQIQSLRQENLKLRQNLKTSLPNSAKIKQHSSSPRPRTPLNQVSTTTSKQSLTPRQKHCPMCDHLLSKGYSTVLCSKHSLF